MMKMCECNSLELLQRTPFNLRGWLNILLHWMVLEGSYGHDKERVNYIETASPFKLLDSLFASGLLLDICRRFFVEQLNKFRISVKYTSFNLKTWATSRPTWPYPFARCFLNCRFKFKPLWHVIVHFVSQVMHVMGCYYYCKSLSARSRLFWLAAFLSLSFRRLYLFYYYEVRALSIPFQL